MYVPDKLMKWRLHVLDASVRSVTMQAYVRCDDDDDEVAVDELTTGDEADEDVDESVDDESDNDWLLLFDMDCS